MATTAGGGRRRSAAAALLLFALFSLPFVVSADVNAGEYFVETRDSLSDNEMPNTSDGVRWLTACLAMERDLRNLTTIGPPPLASVHVQGALLTSNNTADLPSTLTTALTRGAHFLALDLFANVTSGRLSLCPLGNDNDTASPIPTCVDGLFLNNHCYACNETLGPLEAFFTPLSNWFTATDPVQLQDIVIVKLNLRFIEQYNASLADPASPIFPPLPTELPGNATFSGNGTLPVNVTLPGTLNATSFLLMDLLSSTFNATLLQPSMLDSGSLAATSLRSLRLASLLAAKRRLIVLFNTDVSRNASTSMLANFGFSADDFEGAVLSQTELASPHTCALANNMTVAGANGTIVLTDDPRLDPACGEAGCPLQPYKVREATRCMMTTRHFLSFDFSDATAHTWTWAANHPVVAHNVNCVYLGIASQRWYTSTCHVARRAACRDPARPPGDQWLVSSTASEWTATTLPVCPSQTYFDAPRDAADNAALVAAMASRGVSAAWIYVSDFVTKDCWVVSNTPCSTGTSSGGLTPSERQAVITVSVIGGVVIVLLVGICLYFKFDETRRFVKLKKYEASLRLKRRAKFVPVPA